MSATPPAEPDRDPNDDERWACHEAEEHCAHCGRLMVRTIEQEDRHDRDTGRRRWRAWHSCPGYFPSLLRQLLTLRSAGLGHESHSEAVRFQTREWR